MRADASFAVPVKLWALLCVFAGVTIGGNVLLTCILTGGAAARTSRAEHGVCVGSVSPSGVAACRSAFRFRRCEGRGASGRARQLL